MALRPAAFLAGCNQPGGAVVPRSSGAGAFYQFYSRPFAGGLFFEVVQRAGGYDGYGAPNAPFRIAAQKRLGRPNGIPKR